MRLFEAIADVNHAITTLWPVLPSLAAPLRRQSSCPRGKTGICSKHVRQSDLVTWNGEAKPENGELLAKFFH